MTIGTFVGIGIAVAVLMFLSFAFGFECGWQRRKATHFPGAHKYVFKKGEK